MRIRFGWLLLPAILAVSGCARVFAAPPPAPVYIGTVIGVYDGHPWSGPTWHAWIVLASGPRKGQKVYLAAVDNECAFQAAIHDGQVIKVVTWTPDGLDGSEVTVLEPHHDTVSSYDGCSG